MVKYKIITEQKVNEGEFGLIKNWPDELEGT